MDHCEIAEKFSRFALQFRSKNFSNKNSLDSPTLSIISVCHDEIFDFLDIWTGIEMVHLKWFLAPKLHFMIKHIFQGYSTLKLLRTSYLYLELC